MEVDGPLAILITIGVDVLPQQDHLSESLLLHHPQLVEDALGLTAAFPATRIAYDAVGTELVTAPHGRDVSRYVAPLHLVRDHSLVGLRLGQLDVHGFLTPLG